MSEAARKRSQGKPSPTTLDACRTCGAKCCHDLVMPIDRPKTPGDVDELKWELQYDAIAVFIRSHRWYRFIRTRCLYLDRLDRCTRYQTRPKRCRTHQPTNCEKFGEFYDAMINTPEELDDFLASRKRTR